MNSQTDDMYSLIGRNAEDWLWAAKRLKMSADLVLKHLLPIINVPYVGSSESMLELMETQLAFIEAFMMLTGFAFENLLKGIDIAKNPNLVDSKKLDTTLWNVRGGHGISIFAKKVVSLNSSEINLLKRLEEYIVWAGRYPIPKSADTYNRASEPYNQRKFFRSDPELINSLFERFTEILVEEWRKQEGLR
jgi:hypothetical protein